jgi:signal transduction histidine kinase
MRRAVIGLWVLLSAQLVDAQPDSVGTQRVYVLSDARAQHPLAGVTVGVGEPEPGQPRLTAAWAQSAAHTLGDLALLPPLDTTALGRGYIYRHTKRWYAAALTNQTLQDSLWTSRIRSVYGFDIEAWLGHLDAKGHVLSWQRLRSTDHSLPPIRSYITWAFTLPPGERAVLLYHGGSYVGGPIISTAPSYYKYFFETELLSQALLYVFLAFGAFFLGYNALLYLTVKERIFWHYLQYVGGTAAYIWFVSQPYVGPLGEAISLPDYNYLAAMVAAIGFSGYAAYGRAFLETRRRQPVADWVFRGVVWTFVVLSVLGAVNLFAQSFLLNEIFNAVLGLALLLIVLSSIWAGIVGVRQLYSPARPYLLAALFPAFSGLLVGTSLITGKGTMGVTYLFPIVYVSFIFEYLFLSLALGSRIRQSDRERDQAQAEAINTLEENHRLVEEQNRELEGRVASRTKELASANLQLLSTLEELNATHEQLVIREKQAERAALLSGLAHEMNTPVGVCVTAASNLSDRTLDVVELSRAGRLTRSELDRFADYSSELASSLVKNLQRVSQLIENYRKVAGGELMHPAKDSDGTPPIG